MKTWMFKLSHIVAAIALVFVSAGANLHCAFNIYQPEFPKQARKYRKF